MASGLKSDSQDRIIPSAADVEAQLKRMLQSRPFAQSARLRQFLKFGVESALARQTTIHEYAIGVAVFKKGPDFDPRIDPIVRVHARRLRSRLAQYYAGEGSEDRIEILLPLRTYIPIFRSRHPSSPLTLADSVGILPFATLSANQEDIHFAGGLTREVTHAFSNAGVWPIRFLEQQKPQGDNPPDLNEFITVGNVQAVLQGTVRKTGHSFRISAELIGIPDRTVLWSGMYEADEGRPVPAQERISREILEQIHERFRRNERTDVRRPIRGERGETQGDGLCDCRQYSRANLEKCAERLRETLAADPEYGAAHAALAETLILLALYGEYAPDEVMPEAKREAKQALEYGSPAGGHVTLGLVKALYEWNLTAAESLFLRAIGMNSRSASAREWYAAVCLAPTGRIDEAVEQLTLAQQLDPLSLTIPNHLAYVLTAAGRTDAAVTHLNECLALDRNFSLTYWTLGLSYLTSGEFNESIRALEHGLELSQDAIYIQASLGHAYGIARRTNEAHRILETLRRKATDQCVAASDIALVHIGLGDYDSALQELGKGRQERCGWLIRMGIDPRTKSLQHDERFAILLSFLRPKRAIA